MLDLKIGIVGIGYVGKACLEFFLEENIKPSSSSKNIKSLVLKSDIIFYMCSGIPMSANGL